MTRRNLPPVEPAADHLPPAPDFARHERLFRLWCVLAGAYAAFLVISIVTSAAEMLAVGVP